MSKSLTFLIVAIVAVAVFCGGYWYGNNVGDKAGYDRGLTDAARIQAGTEGSGSQVDTGYKNPYEDVNLNPFK